MGEALQWLSAGEAAARIRAGELTPTEYVESIVEWIDRVDGRLRNVEYLDREGALAAAERATAAVEADEALGPLHGVPFTVKDLIEVAGTPMGCGSDLLGDFRSTSTATVVERLRDAGGIFLGKVVAHEFACGVTSPPARNPWDTDAVPGGSSGGSGSAVAAGEAPLSVGTDAGASIRNPAALNGAVGVRPTQGRVPQTGVVPLSMTFDTTGPLARSVEGAARMLTAMAGYDPADPTASTAPTEDFTATLEDPVDGLTVGVPGNYFFEHIEPAVERAVREAVDALTGLGMDRVDVTLPDVDQTVPVWNTIVPPENAALFEELLAGRDRDRLGDDLKRHIMAGNTVLAKDYARANQMRTVIQRDFARAFSEVDVLITPATAATAKVPESREDPIRIDVTYPDGYTEDVAWAYARYTLPVSLAGTPAAVVPCGFDGGDMPIGMQIVAPAFDEATALRVAAAYERATDWSDRRPPIAT